MIRSIVSKSAIVAIASVLASLAIVSIVVPMIGGTVDGNAWVMSIVCPLVIAGPASAHMFWQRDRLCRAHDELAQAHILLAQAHAQLREKASRDDMTGMLNRENFFASLDRTRGNAGRGVLLLVDADHFKRINDGWGHLVGDDALQAIAAAIGRGVRSGDILGRIGGEEFGVLVRAGTEREGLRVAERIRREVELIQFRPRGERLVPLTVSVGAANCDVDASVSELMRAADERLYEAKRGGRNCVVLTNLALPAGVAA